MTFYQGSIYWTDYYMTKTFILERLWQTYEIPGGVKGLGQQQGQHQRLWSGPASEINNQGAWQRTAADRGRAYAGKVAGRFIICIQRDGILHQRVPQKMWQLVSRDGHFCHFRGLFLCNAKRLQLSLIKKPRTYRQSSASLLFPYVFLFLNLWSCCFCLRRTNFSPFRRLHCHFYGCWLKHIFYTN